MERSVHKPMAAQPVGQRGAETQLSSGPLCRRPAQPSAGAVGDVAAGHRGHGSISAAQEEPELWKPQSYLLPAKAASRQHS